jgi:hypothetical protein
VFGAILQLIDLKVEGELLAEGVERDLVAPG